MQDLVGGGPHLGDSGSLLQGYEFWHVEDVVFVDFGELGVATAWEESHDFMGGGGAVFFD